MSPPMGTAALAHIAGIAGAALVPLVMLLDYLGDPVESRSAWTALERIDVVVLIFCLLAATLLTASLLGHRRALCVGAAALLFACFGLLLAFPLDLPAQSEQVEVRVSGYLAPLVALLAAGAALYAAELAPPEVRS